MANSKNTKRDLLTSALSLAVCAAMLIGSTFAWFTDSAASAGNKIQAGTLDIDLLVKDTWTDAYQSVKDSKEAVFDYDKWEPGYTDVKYIQVKTTGNLALKYTLSITPYDEVGRLAEVIDVYYAPEEVEVKDRDVSALQRLGTLQDVFAGAENTIIRDTLIPQPKAGETADTEDFATIVLKMQETAGNEYQGLSVGGGFDLQLMAAQYAYEEDGFGSQDYDQGAAYYTEVATAADFAEAIQPNSTVLLSDDIDLAEAGYDGDHPFVIDADNVTVDLNGKTIDTLNVAFTVTGENVVIKNGTIARPEGGDYSYGLKLNGVNTTVENVTLYSGINVSGYDPVDNSIIKPDISARIVNCDITLDCKWAYYAVCAQGEASVIMDGGTINRTHPGKANNYFWVEKSFTDALGHVGDSYIGYRNVEMHSDCGTTLYNTGGLAPEELH